MQSCRKAETERALKMNDSTKNEILTGLTRSFVELMMSQISDVQVDVPDAEEIADHFDASDIAEHINISASDVANNLDVDDVATYVADNLDTNDVADHIDVSDLATYIDASEVAGHIDVDNYITDIGDRIAAGISSNDVADCINESDIADHINASDVADYIDTEDVANYIDISKVADHMLTKSYEESDGSELSLELKLIRNLVSANEVLAKQLHDADELNVNSKVIISALQDSLDRVTRERNQLQLDNEQAERDDKEAEVH